MTCHFSDTTRERWSHGKQRLKRWVLRRLRKIASDVADVTCSGRLFQIRGAATGKARSPRVDSRVQRTISDDAEAERSLRRRHRASVSAGWQSSSATLIDKDREPACSQSAPPPSTNVVDGGVGWCARTSTRKTPAEQQNSSPTEAASAGTAECRREWHFRDPAASERVTSPATGERI